MKQKRALCMKTVALCLSVCLVLGLTALAAASSSRQITVNDGIQVELDGQLLHLTDVNGKAVLPFAYGGTTYLPVRGLAEALGLSVSYDAAENRAVLKSTAYSMGAAAAAYGAAACRGLGEYEVLLSLLDQMDDVSQALSRGLLLAKTGETDGAQKTAAQCISSLSSLRGAVSQAETELAVLAAEGGYLSGVLSQAQGAIGPLDDGGQLLLQAANQLLAWLETPEEETPEEQDARRNEAQQAQRAAREEAAGLLSDLEQTLQEERDGLLAAVSSCMGQNG